MKTPCLSLLLLFILAACAGPEAFSGRNATGHYADEIEQCVPYARRVSGVNLYGDADSWWHKAGSQYQRGNLPAPGAVLVLKRTDRMRSGHVAVVKDIIGARQINVTHTNWGNNKTSRRIIYESMLAEDASATGDWSQVRFWNKDKDVLGFPYAAYGFIYR